MRVDEFERLYADHAESLLAFLVYRTGDHALAEDVLSEAFEKALRARLRFDPRRASRKTWLYTIALNSLRDQLRRRDAERRALERTGVGGLVATTDEDVVADRDLVLRALDVLSEDERTVIALRFGADLTVPEMARALGQRRAAVEARTYRALKKLRAHLPGS